ncbi:hypothetical protein [Roseomonas sp. KE0001]|uniref:hypothetical protein n=1 Tax=unclassified Roseomonas TaxID=2617492 RepID=UPI000DB72BE0|nr:hypothetical protein [Roseomonas sp. KE0001]MBI0436133.1 hypothetical protein [Roseomonas sp. KE0001]PZO66882.1 MAG: hypothetical protein DI636_10585 [Pelagerythrobacter marensis]
MDNQLARFAEMAAAVARQVGGAWHQAPARGGAGPPRAAEVVPLPVARDGKLSRKPRSVGAMVREFQEGAGKLLVQEGW